jgi:hypothetical protein
LPHIAWLPFDQEVGTMWDVWVIVITAVIFTLAFGLVRWFDQI